MLTNWSKETERGVWKMHRFLGHRSAGMVVDLVLEDLRWTRICAQSLESYLIAGME